MIHQTIRLAFISSKPVMWKLNANIPYVMIHVTTSKVPDKVNPVKVSFKSVQISQVDWTVDGHSIANFGTFDCQLSSSLGVWDAQLMNY